MGLFDLFKGKNKNIKSAAGNGIAGPTYFEGLTEDIIDPKGLLPHEWRRQLKSSSGQATFGIRFYGQLHQQHPNLIVGTDFAPALVVAVDHYTGKQILLFDGCKHGYNALLGDVFTEEQMKNRRANEIYKDKDGNDSFEIIISTYNSINYEEEFGDEVDENGLIEIANGSKMEFETAKRNGFDVINIFVKTSTGKTINIVSEELA